jgi:hypothetical protein
MAGNKFAAFMDLVSKDEASEETYSGGPSSGVVSTPLFRGNAGPGYWVHPDTADPIHVTLESGGEASGEVLRLSPTALWFVPSSDAGFRMNGSIRFYLGRGQESIGPLTGKVIPLSARSTRPCVGLQLSDVPLEAGRRMVRWLGELLQSGRAEVAHTPSPVLEEISNPKRIVAVMTALAGVGNTAVLGWGGGRVQASVLRVDSAAGRVYWKTDGPLTSFAEAPYRIDVVGYNSVYRLIFAGAALLDGQLVTPLPVEIRRVRHRWFRRGPVRGTLRIRYQHPLWGEMPVVSREVRDISFGGLCFATDPTEDLVFPGLHIPDLELVTPSGEVIHLAAEVRNILPGKEGEALYACGVSVSRRTPEDEQRWVRLVSEMLYTTTRTSENMTEPLWDLFRDSGYFNLAGKTTEKFTELKRGFGEVGRRGAEASDLFCQAVWPSERGVEATVSFLKAYHTTWMGHQLAKRPGKPPAGVVDPGQMLRDVYLRTFEHAQSDPAVRWVVCYVEPSVPWIQRSHLDFAYANVRTRNALAAPIRMMNVRAAELSGLGDGGLDIGYATEGEEEILTAAIRRIRPNSYVEALDFVSSRLSLGGVRQQWQGVGLERGRRILVARKDRVPIAAVVVEIGEVGTNLFRLLDSTRLFSLAPEGSSAFVALMDAARRWFHERGRSSFLFLHEDDDWSYVDAARLEPESEPYLWIISSALIPDFLEHVCELTSRRRAAS